MAEGGDVQQLSSLWDGILAENQEFNFVYARMVTQNNISNKNIKEK